MHQKIFFIHTIKDRTRVTFKKIIINLDVDRN